MPNPLTFSLTIALCLSASAFAGEPSPAPVRTILERHAQTGVSGKEILLGTAFLPAGAVIGFHTHAGDEFGYVLKGPLVWKRKGEPDRILKTGDSFYNARGGWFIVSRRCAAVTVARRCLHGSSTKGNLSPLRQQTDLSLGSNGYGDPAEIAKVSSRMIV